jgi:hypothetical protein
LIVCCGVIAEFPSHIAICLLHAFLKSNKQVVDLL